MKERILITVKTYPTISRKYSELVCTAGLREDGSWIRIYPVPFRKLNEPYNKFQWIEVEVVKNKSDRRPESHKLVDPDAIDLKEKVGTENGWRNRKEYVLNKGAVYDNISELIERNKKRELSLATFKPCKIVDFTWEAVDREWDPGKIEGLKEMAKQSDLFDDAAEVFRLVRKLPYAFRYRLIDSTGKERHMMIEDWEIGALYWNCLNRHGGDEEKAILDVRKKYFDEFVAKTDLHLFLGTTLQYDGWGQNPFVIVGVFTPPPDMQQALF